MIQQCQAINKKDFTFKNEVVRGKLGKRQYLNDARTRDFMEKLDLYFRKKVEIPRIYMGKQQIFETLINEEALQLARHLSGSLGSWKPRMTSSSQ